MVSPNRSVTHWVAGNFPQIVSSAMAIGTPMKVPGRPHRPVQKKTENRTRNGEIESALPAIRGYR